MAPSGAAAGVTRFALRLRLQPGEPGSGTGVLLPLLCSFDEDWDSAAGPAVLLLPLGAGVGVVLPPVATVPGAVALEKGVGVLGGSDALPPPPAAAAATTATGAADTAAAPAGVEAGGTEWEAEARLRLLLELPEESRWMLDGG